ncbi:MAG: hypothetical protein WCL06_06895 [Bacteroidota bacterium]
MADPVDPVVKYYEAVLKLPRANDKLIIYLKGIYDKMHADDRYLGSAAKLALLTDHVTKFDKAEVGYKLKPPSVSKADRDDAKNVAIMTAKGLRSDVQALADADNPNAKSLITGANMSVKEYKVRPKQKSEVKDTNESGVVIVLGEGEGPHEWMMSTDGINWTPLTATHTARKKVSGLTAGKTYHFKSRQILPHDEYSAWTNPVEVLAR